MKSLKTVVLGTGLLCAVSAGGAESTTVAQWEFTTGYDEAKTGTVAVYTPNDLGWAATANQKWSTVQPYFLPNACAMLPTDCRVTVHTSDGKWQLTSSGSTPSYLLRLNTASTDRFTAKADYADGTKHDQYFEVSLPTVSLTNVKINFAIGDGSSSSTPFGVVYSTDGGTTWTVLNDYVCAGHWNKYTDATYALKADNCPNLTVRFLIGTASKTSNYNLKYLNILADDFQAPALKAIVPAPGEKNVVTTGKISVVFDESVKASGADIKATLTNRNTNKSNGLKGEIDNNKVTFAYDGLDLSTPYIFTMGGSQIADLAGNVSTGTVSTDFDTADSRPVPPPVLDSKNRLWYNRPAGYWEEALPLGNGRLGAMVSGSVACDTIQLNEDTFWGQSPNSNHNANALGVMKQVRDLIFKKDYASAQKLAIPNFMSQGSHGAQYQAAGCVLIGFPGHRYNDAEAGAGDTAHDAQGYVRDLDMSRAVATTTYIVDGVTYTREVFTSLADNVTVVRLTASQPGRLNFNVAYAAPIKTNMAKLDVCKITDGMIEASLVPAKTRTENVDNKLNCFTFVKVLNDGGTLSTDRTATIIQQGLVAGNNKAPMISVTDANSAVVIISSATNFVNYSDISDDAEAKARGYVDRFLQSGKDYDTALANHIDLYRQQFDRVSLDLGTNPDREVLDTENRIRAFNRDADDPGLVSNYFQFGRYLLISSSQPGSQPANLQGLWNPNARQYPAWDSKYTTNINVEMNYWGAEVANLAECHEPFVEMVKDVAETGTRTASEMYGARGWVLHHNTDLWRTTGAVDNGAVGIWPTCNAWFCSHLWEKYLFSGDKDYLAQIYPVLKGCSEFFQDFLVEDPNTHYMVVCPSNSPENHPGQAKYTDDAGKEMNVALFGGVAMDNQMVYDVLKNTADAARILGVDGDFATDLDNLRARLTPYKIGRYGQIQEWQEDWDRESTTHRHISHLWGAYPGNQISPYVDATLFQGAYKSLTGRGDAARGWSMGWKVCLWARMLDGDHALTIIRNQLRLVSPNITISDPNGGTYANFFDSHAPFQIDGNFGCSAGIAEMLLQSHAGFIHLLPALPSKWDAGNVRGLRARGGFTVDEMVWKGGKVNRVVITSTVGGNLRLRSNARLYSADGSALATASGDNTNELTAPCVMPRPVVADKSKIPATELPETFLYDIPTTPGQVVELTSQKSAVETVAVDDETVPADARVLYNIYGQRVGAGYRGIVVSHDDKHLKM